MNETNRVFNRYVGKVEAFRCPSDNGDARWDPPAATPAVDNCYTAWGNSYSDQWSTRMQIQRVTGADMGNNKPMNEVEMTQPTTKFVLADWIWHRDRGVTVKKNQWHNYAAEKRTMTLFGDGHAEFFKFPAIWFTWANGTPAPDPANGFW